MLKRAKLGYRRRLALSPRRAKIALAKRRYGLTKRRKFLIVAVILSIYLFFVQKISPEDRILWFVGYFVISYVLSAWSLYSDLNGVEWLTNLTLPALFPVSVGLLYFLLPQLAITRMIIMVVLAVGMYALLLTQNIFVVASIRTIQLLRAARAVGFLLTVITGAFLFDVILSMRMGVSLTAISVFVVCWLLFVQGLWCSVLEERISRKVFTISTVSSLIVAQLALVLTFWFVDVAMASIFLAMGVYVLLGVFQHELEGRLFRKTLQEYMGFAMIVMLIVAASVFLRWGS